MFVFKLVRPNDTKKIGLEMLRLAAFAGYVGDYEIGALADIVREGFAFNFTSQASAEGPWGALARRTREERADLGIGSAEPILDRTGGSHGTGGSYMKSWIERGHPRHIQFVERQPGFSQDKTEKESIFMSIGSTDPRVDKLSGGLEGSLLMDSFGEIDAEGFAEGRLPPRPVNPIMERFETALDNKVTNLLDRMALRVK